MNETSHLPARVRSLRSAATLAVAALLLSGCDNFFDIVEEPEPVQGAYKAVASPQMIELTALNTSAVVTVNAVAVGDHLPPNVDQNQPDWSSFADTDEFQAVVADPTSPSTTVTITYTGNLNPPYDKASWNRHAIASHVFITPLNVPDGMLFASDVVSVRFSYGTDVDEEIAETPRLTILPARLSFLPGATRVLTVVYKGPDAAINSGGITPSGPDFSSNAASRPVKDGDSFNVSITYSSTAPASTAVFHLGTSNGFTVSVPLTGLGIPP